MKYIIALSLVCLLFSCKEQDQTTASGIPIPNEFEEITNLKTELRKLNNPTMMHTVFVWLKDDLSEEEMASFVASAKTLGSIRAVSRFRMGGPASTEDREVVDHSYSYAFNIEFSSEEEQKAYQIDPIHLAFVEQNKDKWTKVVVYDNKFE